MKRSLFLAAVSVVAIVVGAACSSNGIDGQGDGCQQTSDCVTGNNLVCVPFSNSAGGSCQIKCDLSKANTCPSNEKCGEISGILPTVCKVVISGAGGSGTTGGTTTGTGTGSSTTSTGG